jgi:hypothetical protein
MCVTSLTSLFCLSLYTYTLIPTATSGAEAEAEDSEAKVSAMERFVLLYRLLGNLHSFYEETCPADQRDYFINLLEKELKARKMSAVRFEGEVVLVS